MLLVAAALGEELRTGLELCTSRSRHDSGRGTFWSGNYSGQKILFLKTGTGPRRSASKLGNMLASHPPDRILLIGYAGALAPDLKIGDLIVLQRTSIFGEQTGDPSSLDQIEVKEEYNLEGSSEFFNLARKTGLRAYCGPGLTSPYIIGDPDQKRTLYRRFQALTIDMETAALVRTSRAAGIPLACVRAISDEADDDVLAPFSYDPNSSTLGRAIRVLGAGSWRDRFSAWRENAAKARESLRGFLRGCLETWTSGDADSSWLGKA